MSDKQRLCHNETNGSAKVSYRTRAAAEKTRRQRSGVSLHVYGPCRFCGLWHLSSTPNRYHGEAPPSLKTLRGRLENAAREIRAADRRLAKIEQKKADAEFRAAHELKQLEFQSELEQIAIDAMIARLGRK